jgi:hypothetical protein
MTVDKGPSRYHKSGVDGHISSETGVLWFVYGALYRKTMSRTSEGGEMEWRMGNLVAACSGIWLRFQRSTSKRLRTVDDDGEGD